MNQTVIQRLAERIRSFGDKNVTKQAIELSRTAIIDTIGVTLAGSVEPCATNLLRTPGIAEAPGPCALFGTKRKASALDATFFNGTADHCSPAPRKRVGSIIKTVATHGCRQNALKAALTRMIPSSSMSTSADAVPANGTTTSSIDHSRSDTPAAIAGLGRHYPVRCVGYVIPENHNPPRPSNK